ncbi:DciA family protein, partial [Streptomyces sp. NRRL B-1347]|uniref:DciA family protein n=1 Tax=Streptomyces sp. NRRL B-1347 TaxID=1476877 RepID=UPI00131E55B9
LPAVGATLRERWTAIASECAGHVAAVAYDADSGLLTVCPESAAWATKARLEQARIIAAANESAGRAVVRALRVLASGTVAVPGPVDADPKPAAAPVDGRFRVHAQVPHSRDRRCRVSGARLRPLPVR